MMHKTLQLHAVKQVGIVGMGLMGHGIAQMAAASGFSVVAVDIDKAQLEKGISAINKSVQKLAEKDVQKGKLDKAAAEKFVAEVTGRISSGSDISAVAQCDLIVEAIVENLEIKKKFFAELGALAKPEAIIASNTSSFPITQLGVASGRPDKFTGVHFFNPVQVMKLVEVIKTGDTSESSFNDVIDFCKAIGKDTVTCGDTPGFIVNRLLVPYLGQALLMLDREDASIADIDTAMKFGANMPMGPFVLADYVGLDTCLSILEGWQARHPGEPAFTVPESLRKLVAAGTLGRKTGSGFYTWSGDKPTGLAQ
eukprot:TRINITY_DN9756_c0_g1_i1.p1 TRINITY_DN9756_c0_g1~~TRINITY_DN9756_c0_g1_i1.p1  ORF type:complete len:310 (+),score=77.33 TRINITY_DN9756_c0_g1_i1:62-991(+)